PGTAGFLVPKGGHDFYEAGNVAGGLHGVSRESGLPIIPASPPLSENSVHGCRLAGHGNRCRPRLERTKPRRFNGAFAVQAFTMPLTELVMLATVSPVTIAPSS